MISLVGLPGCGKTTVGRQLARRLRVPFLDTDQHIEDLIGCSIRSFFELEGEERFRELEASVVEELTARAAGVLSTGGGVVLREANRRRLRACTHVVYLNSSPEELFRRLHHDTSRPLLQVADPLRKLRELHEQRDPWYREVAHFIVDTGRPTVATLANIILTQLELAGVLPSH